MFAVNHHGGSLPLCDAAWFESPFSDEFAEIQPSRVYVSLAHGEADWDVNG